VTVTDIHEANRRYWDDLASDWQALRDRDGLWRRCAQEPELAFEGGALELILSCCGDLAGTEACVIGSGDNYAAFALAGLGARVTSTDISQRQLDIAHVRAGHLGLDIDFVRADAAGLAPLPDNAFDLVCSTNGFFVWISQPARVFAAVQRVLKPGGVYIFYDIHPFQRPWQDQVEPLQMEKSYWDTGPYTDDEGTFEFNWTLADLVHPLADAGLLLKKFAESPRRGPRLAHRVRSVALTPTLTLPLSHSPRTEMGEGEGTYTRRAASFCEPKQWERSAALLSALV